MLCQSKTCNGCRDALPLNTPVRPYKGLHVFRVSSQRATRHGGDGWLGVRAGREGERRELADNLHRVDAQVDDRAKQVEDVAGVALLTAP